MIIYAVDPGKTAGLVTWHEDHPSPWGWRQDSGMYIVAAVDGGLRTHGRYAVVVVERYTFTTISHTRQYDALEMIGALRFTAWQHGARFELQSRGDKSRVSNDVIARYVQIPHDSEHARDAARHCLVAIARHRPQSVIMMQLAGTMNKVNDGAR